MIGKTDGAITRDAPVEKGGRLGYFEKWVKSRYQLFTLDGCIFDQRQTAADPSKKDLEMRASLREMSRMDAVSHGTINL